MVNTSILETLVVITLPQGNSEMSIINENTVTKVTTPYGNTPCQKRFHFSHSLTGRSGYWEV